MKMIKPLLALVCIITLVFSCQKELNFDPNGPSLGTLKKDGGGDCLPSTVNGIYQKDTALNATNYIEVQVNVTIAGTYDIKSDSVNGIIFKGSGNFGAKGLNTVRLYGSGKPLVSGYTTFVVKYGTSTCNLYVNVIGAATGAAVFTLAGAPGTCSGAIVNGTYTAGTALTLANTVTLNVNVTTPGTYTLAAASVNGMLFTASGVFTTTGVQAVTLAGAGTPLIAGPFNATATDGTSSCTFSIIVLPAASGAATFTLNGAPAACSGALVNGTYTAGTPLVAATNTVSLQVTVLTLGTYTISTNTLNGISFSATGTFSTVGPQTVVLAGTGTPTAAGTHNFTATAGLSSCTFSVTTLPAAGGASACTLDGSPAACTGALVAGTYTTGTVLIAANTATLNVTVTTIGTYSISTNTVNGYSFSKTGTFTVTGPQTVVLNATGNPIAAGTNNFTATNNGTPTASMCTFSVTVAAPVVNTDYFPLTANSWWHYDSDVTAPDSLYKNSTVLQTAAGNQYRKFTLGLVSTGQQGDSTLYRKSGSDYYIYVAVDSFASDYLDVDQYAEFIFLKENAALNTTWESAEYIGTYTSIPVKIKYSFTVTAVNTTRTVNGTTYSNVYEITWKSMENLNNAGYTDEVLYKSYFAKGIGLIEYQQDYVGAPGVEVKEFLRSRLVL